MQSLYHNSKKTFFKSIKTTCKEFLAENSYCDISFFLNLKKELPNSDENNILFFDHWYQFSGINLNNKDIPFKQFNFFYENGAKFNDDGSPYEIKRTIGRVTWPINKAVLQYRNVSRWSNLGKYALKTRHKRLWE